MPHSSKKYKKQEYKQSSRFEAKWIALIIVVGLLIILPTLYFTYPPMSSAVQSMDAFFTRNSNPPTTSNLPKTSNTPTTSNGNQTTTRENDCASGCVYAIITTSQGVIEVELFQGMTPKTVNNFVSLANSGFYNNLVWHRIVEGFVIQTGDPLTRNGGGNQATWGTGGSNTSVPLEAVATLHNDVGYLAMAHTSASTNATSQFYINLANTTSLDGQYTVFGKVIKGMNVVDAIAALPVNSQTDIPLNPQQAMMVSVTIQNAP